MRQSTGVREPKLQSKLRVNISRLQLETTLEIKDLDCLTMLDVQKAVKEKLHISCAELTITFCVRESDSQFRVGDTQLVLNSLLNIQHCQAIVRHKRGLKLAISQLHDYCALMVLRKKRIKIEVELGAELKSSDASVWTTDIDK